METLFVSKGGAKHELKVDLGNSLSTLKFRVFQVMRVHPLNQTLKFGNKVLGNDAESLQSYGLVGGSIVELVFKVVGNQVPSTFADKFHFKDIRHVRVQSEESLTELRANLLALTAHLAEDDKLRFGTFIRAFSHDLPLTFGLKCLLNSNFVSQCHRIAIEEGLLMALSDYIKSSSPQLDALEYKNNTNHNVNPKDS